MARFDVHRSGPRSLVIDIQADLHSLIRTRVVVPLLPTTSSASLRDLNPVIMVEDQSYLFASQLLFSIDRRRLGSLVVNLSEYRDEIIRALDALFTGF